MATVPYYGSHTRTGWTITEGIVLMILGIVALASPVATAAAVSLVLPIVLGIEGVVLIVSAFGGRTFGSAVWHVLLGVVALLAAAAVFAEPIIAIASLPIILGTYLFAKGLLQIAIGASAETGGRGWMYTSAAINILLAVLLWAQPFGASLVLIGIYVGVSIFMLGVLLLAAPPATRGREEMG